MPAALVLVVSLLVGSELSAQDGPAAARAPLRPAELVAQQVRSVLYARDEGAALRELAGALPELAISGEADPRATFEAARLAEELSLGTSASSTQAEVGSAGFVLDSLEGLNVELLGTLLAVIAASAAIWMASGRERLRLIDLSLIARKAKGLRIPVWATSWRRIVQRSRVERARSLTTSGVPLAEVARQTGFSRDALAVLLRLGQ